MVARCTSCNKVTRSFSWQHKRRAFLAICVGYVMCASLFCLCPRVWSLMATPWGQANEADCGDDYNHDGLALWAARDERGECGYGRGRVVCGSKDLVVLALRSRPRFASPHKPCRGSQANISAGTSAIVVVVVDSSKQIELYKRKRLNLDELMALLQSSYTNFFSNSNTNNKWCLRFDNN